MFVFQYLLSALQLLSKQGGMLVLSRVVIQVASLYLARKYLLI